MAELPPNMALLKSDVMKTLFNRSAEIISRAERRKIMLRLLFFIMSWICFYAFVQSRKNKTEFSEEFKIALSKCGEFVFTIIDKLSKLKVDEKTVAKRMAEDAMKMNHQIETMVDFHFSGSRGWRYITANQSYALTHGKPVEIGICLQNGQEVKATVIVKNSVVCDIVLNNSNTEARTEFTQAVSDFTQPAAAATSEEKKEEPEEPEEPEKDVTSSEKEKIEDTLDEEKAIAIAANYLADEYGKLDNLANEALANGKTCFEFTPDVDGGEAVLEQISNLLVSKLGYEQSTIKDGKMLVVINLDTPTDDGNYDFEKKDEPKSSVPETAVMDCITEDEEKSDGILDDGLLIPSEPDDIPEDFVQ